MNRRLLLTKEDDGRVTVEMTGDQYVTLSRPEAADLIRELVALFGMSVLGSYSVSAVPVNIRQYDLLLPDDIEIGTDAKGELREISVIGEKARELAARGLWQFLPLSMEFRPDSTEDEGGHS